MVGTFFFLQEPLFKGCDNKDQLVKIVSVLGSAPFWAYVAQYQLEVDEKQRAALSNHETVPWNRYVTKKNAHLVTPEVLDLLSRLLVFDHQKRLTAKETMQHPLFRCLSK